MGTDNLFHLGAFPCRIFAGFEEVIKETEAAVGRTAKSEEKKSKGKLGDILLPFFFGKRV
jgi:hypothetical protein